MQRNSLPVEVWRAGILFVILHVVFLMKAEAMTANENQPYIPVGQFITISDITLQIQNLTIQKGAVARGTNTGTQFFIAFDIPINNNPTSFDQMKLYEDRLFSVKRKIIPVIKITMNSRTGKEESIKPIQEIVYQSATVQEFKLNSLNKEAKVPVTIHVELECFYESSASESTINFGNLLTENGIAALGSNFKMQLGSLETTRIADIGGLSIGSADSDHNIFSVKILAADKQSWADFFDNGAGAGAAKIIPEGKIEIEVQDEDKKKVALTIYLRNVSIISYKSETTDGQSQATVTYGLKAGSISLYGNNQ